MVSLKKILLFLSAFALVLVLVPPPAKGADFTWQGGGADDNWSTAGNWDVFPIVSAADTGIIFDTNLASTPNQNIFAPPFILNSLTITAFETAGLNLTGSQIQFSGAAPSFQNTTAAPVDIQTALDLAVSTTFGGASATISGNITGGGLLTINGPGTLTLTGVNTYSGSTTVTSGILSGNTTSLQGFIFNNSTVVFDQAVDGTYANVMAGTGVLEKTGAGKLILAGANAYSGGTTVSAGILEGNATSLQGNITNNSSVIFNQVADGTYSDSISGTGTMEKTGAGKLTLSGANSYSGGTTITTGILEGDTTSLQGDIINNTALIFNQTGADGVYLGVISGTGSLEKIGASKLSLGGENTYAGGTTVTEGTLEGLTSSLQGDITNNAALIFFQFEGGEYADVISGTGTLEKTGTQELILSNAHTYTGTTTVTSGNLVLNGSIGPGLTTVANGATISGTGTVTGDLNNSGVIAPGNSVGTLNITGNYDHDTTATYTVEISPAAADKINVTGNANIQGGVVNSVIVDSIQGFTPKTYTILQAAAVTGTFDTINTPGDTAVLSWGLDYLADRVNLELSRNNYVTLAATRNQRAVAAALENIRIGATGDLATVLSALDNLDLGPFRTALDDIGPRAYSATSRISLNTAKLFNGGIVGRMGRVHNRMRQVQRSSANYLDQLPQLAFNGGFSQLAQLALSVNGANTRNKTGRSNDGVIGRRNYLRSKRQPRRNAHEQHFDQPAQTTGSYPQVRDGTIGAWAQQFNTHAKEDGSDDQVGFDFDTHGIMLGSDIMIVENLVVGGAIGYSRTHINLNNNVGEGDIDSLRTTIYATFLKDSLYIDGALGFGFNWYHNTRIINFVNRVAKSNHNGFENIIYLGGGYDFDISGWILGPIASLQYVYLIEDSFNETSAGAMNLTVDYNSSHSLMTALGVRFARAFDLDTVVLTPEVRVEWLHEYLNDEGTVTSRFTTGGGTFSINAQDPESDSAAIGVRLNAGFSENVSVYLNYELLLQGSGGMTANSLWGGIRIEF